jgi:Spy/CpxP family protein refolding chaperone
MKYSKKGGETMVKKLALAAAVMFFVLPFAYAEAGPGPGPDMDDGIGPEMAIGGIFKVIDELKLTPEQETKLQEMRDSSKREMLSLRTELKTTVWDIQDEFKKDKVDRAKINSLTDKMADIEKKLIKARTEHMFKVREILTLEQFKQMITLLEKHKGKMQKKFREKMNQPK